MHRPCTQNGPTPRAHRKGGLALPICPDPTQTSTCLLWTAVLPTHTLASPHSHTGISSLSHWDLLTLTPGSPHSHTGISSLTHWDLLTHTHRDLLTHTCWDLLTHTQDSLPSYFPLDTTAGLYLGTISPVHSHPVP